MSSTGFQLVFPPSRKCLWDRQHTAEPVQLSVESNSWVRVHISSSALQLAVRVSQQAAVSPLHCLLLGSACVSHENGLVIEVDRFDNGHSGPSGLEPTALIPGDVIVHCTVGSEDNCQGSPHNIASLMAAVAELRSRLLSPIVMPDASSLLHLSVKTVIHANSAIAVECDCIHPSHCVLSPLHPLPVVQTALARNLSGPLPLPLLQGAVKWGYLSMEITRKLVLLLNSDPKVLSVPLVGVWLSGVNSIHHPAVWACILHYKYCGVLGERVRNEDGGWLCLVYASNQTQPTLWEVCAEEESDGEEFVCSTGEANVECTAESTSVTLELHPKQSPSSQTLLHQAVSQNIPSCSHLVLSPQPTPAPHPTPSPHPTLTKDSQLSCFSTLCEGSEPLLCTSHSVSSTAPSLTPQSAPLLTPQPPPSKASNSAVHNSGSASSTQTLSSAAAPPSPSVLPGCMEPSLTVFPEKQRQSLPPESPPSAQELLRQREQQLRSVQLQLTELLAAHRTPTAEMGTNTGRSLWCRPERTPSPQSTECSMGEVSITTPATLLSSHPHSSLHLDLCSFAPSSSPHCPSLEGSSNMLCDGSVREEEEVVNSESAQDSAANLLLTDQYRFYQNMLAKVTDLLQESPQIRGQRQRLQLSSSSTESVTPHSTTLTSVITPHTSCLTHHTSPAGSMVSVPHPRTGALTDLSLLPVPRIVDYDQVSLYPDLANDETAQSADIIAHKYVHNTSVDVTGISSGSGVSKDVTLDCVSLDTKNYLQRHQLLPNAHKSQVLDIGRLRTLPKLF